MRERRWETIPMLEFGQVLAVGDRLASAGLPPAGPAKDIICYIEDWTVVKPDDFDRLDPWTTEDVTLVLNQERWKGDFFLLAGEYHTIYQRHQSVGTYCSISHPWKLGDTFFTLHNRAMFWLGFRHDHGFIRVRLHTTDVITPGETRGDSRRDLWVEERRQAFMEASELLELPISYDVQQGKVGLQGSDPRVPFFCSWPDAFGPCQFEYNTNDPFEFLVPASRLAATTGEEPDSLRVYLTGFTEDALEEFQSVCPEARSAYRCSAHAPLDELPELLREIEPTGRLYATLCEFQTQGLESEGQEASVIVGIVGAAGRFQIEVRINRAPLPEEQMEAWLEDLVGLPVSYAPLPPFP